MVVLVRTLAREAAGAAVVGAVFFEEPPHPANVPIRHTPEIPTTTTDRVNALSSCPSCDPQLYHSSHREKVP